MVIIDEQGKISRTLKSVDAPSHMASMPHRESAWTEGSRGFNPEATVNIWLRAPASEHNPAERRAGP
jgi:hypothetical protein